MRGALVLLVVTVGAPPVAHAGAGAPLVRRLPRGDDTLAPAQLDPELLTRAYERARLQRNLGMALALPGITATVIGAALIGFGASSPNLFERIDKIIAGVVTDAAGLALGIPGVYFWVRGQDDMDAVSWRRRQLSERP